VCLTFLCMKSDPTLRIWWCRLRPCRTNLDYLLRLKNDRPTKLSTFLTYKWDISKFISFVDELNELKNRAWNLRVMSYLPGSTLRKTSEMMQSLCASCSNHDAWEGYIKDEGRDGFSHREGIGGAWLDLLFVEIFIADRIEVSRHAACFRMTQIGEGKTD
jgi:hypothetical protein